MKAIKQFIGMPRLPRTIRAWLKVMAAGLVVVAVVIVGLFFRYAEIGTYLIAAYGVAAILLKISSEISFKMLLIVIGCMPVLSLRSDDELIATLSVYALLLLMIGTISLVIEQATSGKKYI